MRKTQCWAISQGQCSFGYLHDIIFQTDVKNGDDCFVRFSMPHETTFKRVFFEKDDMIRLQPRNQKYPPQVVEGGIEAETRPPGTQTEINSHEALHEDS